LAQIVRGCTRSWPLGLLLVELQLQIIPMPRIRPERALFPPKGGPELGQSLFRCDSHAQYAGVENVQQGGGC
jgi:hypothetical protein